MKNLILSTGIALSLMACEPGQKTDAATESPATISEAPAPQGDESATQSPSSDEVNYDTELAGLEGMQVDEALELDNFRDRLAFESMDDVIATLSASAAQFEKDGPFVRAEGEVTNEGFPFMVILVADLARDAVFGAQYDSQSGETSTFMEKPGLDLPTPMQRWVDDLQ